MAHEATPAFGDALCSMNEAFHFQPAVTDDAADLVERALPGEDNTCSSLFLEEFYGGRVGYAHLRGDVERHAVLFAQGDNSPVCNDKCVYERFCRRDESVNLFRFILKDNGVEREIPFYGFTSGTRLFATPFDFRKITDGEVNARTLTHVEFAESEIHGIGTGVKRGLKACHIPCGGKYLYIVNHAAHYTKSTPRLAAG